MRFCSDTFDVTLRKTTAHDYLTKGGFSSRSAKHHAHGFRLDNATMAHNMYDWVRERQRAGDFGKLRASIDVTYTQRRTGQIKTFTSRGSRQPKSSRKITQYTNAIVTCIWNDGQDRTPPALFTFNGKFRQDRVGRQSWHAENLWLNHCLEEYNLDPATVIYMGADKNEKRLFVGESSDMIRTFLGLYEIPPGAIVYSDNGRCFFPGGQSCLLEFSFSAHVPYPASVHALLSPNDNNLHGAAKRTWAESGVDATDDVSSSLLLVQHLRYETNMHSKHWFVRNMEDLTIESARELVGGRRGKRAKLDDERRYEYRVFAGLDARPPGVSLPDGLDGKFWRLE